MRRRSRILLLVALFAASSAAPPASFAQPAGRRPLPSYAVLPPGFALIAGGGRDAAVEYGRDKFDYQPAPGQPITHVSADGHNWILFAKATPAPATRLDQAAVNAAVRGPLVAQGWEILAERPWLTARREKGGVVSWLRLEGNSDFLSVHVLEEASRWRRVSLTPPAAVPEPLASDVEPPYIGRFPGAVKYMTSFAPQAAIEFREPGDKEGKWMGRPLWRGEYRGPADISPFEFNLVYSEALMAAGWTIIQNTGGASVGDAVLAAHFANGTRDLWLKIHVTNAGYDVSVADAAAAAEATRLKHALDRDGHIALYGIYFDSDSSALKPASEATLAQIVKLLTANPSLAVGIEGHTDNTSTRPHNQTLSEERAASVVQYLVAHGIAADRLTSAGFADTRPVEDNGSAQGRATNRRVELVKKT